MPTKHGFETPEERAKREYEERRRAEAVKDRAEAEKSQEG
jgi:hypothetical protein